MAFRVNKTVSWNAGGDTPNKYEFGIDAYLTVEDLINNVAVININGTVTVTNYPTNSRNSWKASDFAVLVPGDVDVDSHPFVYGTAYYQYAIPFLPDPQNGDVDKVILEFRGDTWASDPVNNNNRSSLWMQVQSLVLDQYDQEGTQTFPINYSYSVTVPQTGNAPVLMWESSGASSSGDYSWMDPEVWATWFDLDYRPGAINDNGTWKSHNRSGGTCHILSNTTGPVFTEMRTVGAPTAMGNSPSLYHDNKWYNMARIGLGG